MDLETGIWFQGLLNFNRLFFTNDSDEPSLPIEKGLEAWMTYHSSEHKLHTASTLKEQVKSIFGKVRIENEGLSNRRPTIVDIK